MPHEVLKKFEKKPAYAGFFYLDLDFAGGSGGGNGLLIFPFTGVGGIGGTGFSAPVIAGGCTAKTGAAAGCAATGGGGGGTGCFFVCAAAPKPAASPRATSIVFNFMRLV
jgi:hypothetical protein